MSRIQLDKLVQNLRQDPKLLAELRACMGDLDEMLEWGRARGYDLTKSELADLAASEQKLSRDDMERVAGGEDAWRTALGAPGNDKG